MYNNILSYNNIYLYNFYYIFLIYKFSIILLIILQISFTKYPMIDLSNLFKFIIQLFDFFLVNH